MKIGLRLVVLLLGMLGLTVVPAKADLQDVLDAGTIRIGVGVENPPFGSIDGSGQPVGFDVEMAQKIAKALGVKLELVQLTAPNRIPYLVTNKIDITVASLAGTPERAVQVMLTAPYAANELGVYGPKATNVKSVSDLGNLKVAVVTGAGQDVELSKIAPAQNIVRFDSDAVANTAYFSGQTDLLGLVNTQITSLKKQRPDLDLEEKFSLKQLSLHMAVRQGDFQLLQWLNSFIFFENTSGDRNATFKKYFEVDLPPMPAGL